MTTYNVNDNITFTQFGITLNGNVTRIIKKGYYEVTYGDNNKTIVADAEIEEGRFSLVVSFSINAITKLVEVCSPRDAMDYIYNVVIPNGWKFEGCTIGARY